MNGPDDKESTADPDPRPEWHTPTLIEEPVVDATKHFFRTGIDRYENINSAYGS